MVYFIFANLLSKLVSNLASKSWTASGLAMPIDTESRYYSSWVQVGEADI